MSEVIKQAQLRNDNAAIMRRVGQGESFVVTVNGVPVADVVPHQRDSGRRRFVPAEEMDRLLGTSPPIDVDAWHRDVNRLDDDRLTLPDDRDVV